jgi:integration host factor subunit beta
MSNRTPGDKLGEGAKRRAMSQPELIRRLAAAHPSIHPRDIAEAVETFFAEIAAGLARGERVELRGFGTFTPKTRRARRARNPRTGAAVEVGERNYLVFHAGKQLHDRLNPVAGLDGFAAITDRSC